MKFIVQVPLALPLTVLVPLVWVPLFGGYNVFRNDAPAFVYFTKASLVFFGSLAGLIALWVSIFHTAANSGTRPSGFVFAGLVIGLLTDSLPLFGLFVSLSRYSDAATVSLGAWILGGPFVVGIWNFVAMLSPHNRAYIAPQIS